MEKRKKYENTDFFAYTIYKSFTMQKKSAQQ